MKWSKDLYVGENMKETLDEVRAQLDKGEVVEGPQLVCLSANSANLFDIIPAKELRLSIYKEYDLKVVGIAADKDEAVELVRQMIEKMYTEGVNASSIFS
ncbi:MAG: hypothetical protein K6F92_07700 [Lachnospiraceae bacterium]|nr:hypothetical protein [Lachnospiraceae bacterium]